MANLLALLQAVLILLSNPTTANSPQVQSLATQAISMATTMLSQPVQQAPVTAIIQPEPPIVIPPIVIPQQTIQQAIPEGSGIGAPDLGSVTPPEQVPDYPTGRYECVDQQGFSSITSGSNPSCSQADPYPPVILKLEYRTASGTTYFK